MPDLDALETGIVAAWELTSGGGEGVSGEERRRRGAWYTPRSIVERLVEAVVTPQVAAGGGLIVDPTCGGGAFLIGVLERLVALGVPAERALERVAGIDVDPGALDVARRAVAAWAGARGVAAWAGARGAAGVGVRLACADSLVEWPAGWPSPAVVIGNPPFLTPLRGGRWPDSAVRWREEHRELLGPYADLAALHVLAAVDRLGSGGRLCFVLPQSIVASRDVAGLREHLGGRANLEVVWASSRRHFDASVLVWAPVLEVGTQRSDRVVVIDDAGRSTRVRTSSWAGLVASAMGVPDVGSLTSASTLGSMVSVAAGFRDEYYGLVPAVSESRGVGVGEGESRLVTSGAIDPLHCRWGLAPTRFAKRSWDRPVVDRLLVESGARSWVDAERRPKILVATQTRVIEPVVDRAGTMVAVTPVLSVRPDPADLSRVAAVLLAPPVSAWALRRWFGTALTANAIKLAAANVTEIPLPLDLDLWSEAVVVVDELTATPYLPENGASGLRRVAELMTAAYQVEAPVAGDVLAWWLSRAPTAGR